MGNYCYNDNTVNVDGKKIEEITVPISNKEYYLHQWPVDEAVQPKINELQQQEEFKELFTTQKMMKHKFYDKYYIGEWNEQGFPSGKGILLVPDNFLYYGEFHNLPDGKGTVELFKEKIKYQGAMKDGKAEGQGKIVSADGRYAFEGIMIDSNPKTGKVTIQNPHDQTKSYTIILENFPEGKSQIQYADGRKYYGYINKRSLAPQGQGTATFPDGSTFEGSWEEGEMHGKGCFSWKDGSSYKGEYQHGRKHGVGTFVFPSKKYYEGDWVYGRQQGKGTLYDPNGQIIQSGIWKEGVFFKENQ